jgi:hypothetical protein
METVNDIFDKHIVMWAVENYVPVKQFRKDEILVVFYENLCRKPQATIQDIFSFVAGRFSPRALRVVAKPSSQTSKDSAVLSGDDLISSWRKGVNNRQIARAVEILNVFGLQSIYGEGYLPLVNGEEALGVLGM